MYYIGNTLSGDGSGLILLKTAETESPARFRVIPGPKFKVNCDFELVFRSRPDPGMDRPGREGVEGWFRAA
jgi:hypothetical protein